MNFWSRLCVARVVGRLYADIAVALTLTSPLLQTQPCAPHSRGTSLDPQDETGRIFALLVHLLIVFSGLPLLLFTYVHNSFLREYLETLCSFPLPLVYSESLSMYTAEMSVFTLTYIYIYIYIYMLK